jgi:hypothetical protein
MLLHLNDVSSLAGHDWYALELSDHPEPTLARVVERIPSLFGESPVEMFIPLGRRDLGVFELLSPFIYLRSLDRPALLKLKTVTGVNGLLTAGDTGHISAVIPIEDSHIQTVITRSQEAFAAHSAGITTNSFVRVITGRLKNFCGVVGEMFGSRAKVLVTLKTKRVWLETEIRNLLNLDRVPVELRVWYYNSALDNLDPALIAEDLKMIERKGPEPESGGPEKPTSKYVSVCMSAFLRQLIHAGELNPAILARRCVEGILSGDVISVSSVRTFRSTIITVLLETVRPGGATNYGKFLRENKQYRPNIKTLREIVAPLNLPEISPNGGRPGWRKGRKKFRKR